MKVYMIGKYEKCMKSKKPHHINSSDALESNCPTSRKLLWPVHRCLYIVKGGTLLLQGHFTTISQGDSVKTVQYPLYF